MKILINYSTIIMVVRKDGRKTLPGTKVVKSRNMFVIDFIHILISFFFFVFIFVRKVS